VEQLKEVIELQAQMNTDASEQNEQHHQVMNRLENQEALMEKSLRQLSHLRTILFERSHHLVEKLKETYDLTTSYVNRLLSGSNKPLTFSMTAEQKEESKSDPNSYFLLLEASCHFFSCEHIIYFVKVFKSHFN